MGDWITLEDGRTAKSSRSYKIRGRQKRKARTSGPFLRFSESYCFGSGSDAKFAWTNIHLSPFFTKTRVDLRDSVSFFRPCPVLDRHSCRSESQHPRCIPGLWD